MKRLIVLALTGLALALATGAQASGGEPIYQFKPNPGNEASVQRGARDFMNYCSGCHGLKYLRYNRLARDNGIPEDLLKANLMFTADKPQHPIESAMPAAAENWFGRMPPDLSLATRKRGPAWVYSFLNTFYLDDQKATGVNNLQLPGAAMPHVLANLQGYQRLEPAHEGAEGEAHGHHGPKFELAVEGTLDPKDYKQFTADLTNFLVYAAEPGRASRIALGGKVLFYLLILFGLAYMLKHEYWKDVH